MTVRFRVTSLACLISILIAAPRLGAQGTTSYQAHFANGPNGPRPWTTEFVFKSYEARTIHCTLTLYSDEGGPLVIDTVSDGTSNNFSFTLPPEGIYGIETTGGGASAIQTGWSVLFCDGPIFPSSVFTYNDPGQPVTAVGVLPSYPADTFISPADYFTGIALANTDAANPLNASIVANNPDGTVAGSATQALAALNHRSFNLNGVIPGLPPTFTGSVTITADNPTMIGLAIGVETNATGFVTYAIPAVSFVALSTSYSGTYNIISGPDAGTSGTLTVNDIGPFDPGKFAATVNVNFKTSGAGGPVEIDQGSTGRGTTIDGCKIPLPGPPWPSGIIGAGQVQSDGSISGTISGCAPTDTDVATFNLSPSSQTAGVRGKPRRAVSSDGAPHLVGGHER